MIDELKKDLTSLLKLLSNWFDCFVIDKKSSNTHLKENWFDSSQDAHKELAQYIQDIGVDELVKIFLMSPCDFNPNSMGFTPLTAISGEELKNLMGKETHEFYPRTYTEEGCGLGDPVEEPVLFAVVAKNDLFEESI